MRRALILLLLLAAVPGQDPPVVDGPEFRIISNDRLSLRMRTTGGAITELLMKDDPGRLNPLEGLGHFVCVDGFGSVSKEERAAGLPGHGEAHRVPWRLVSSAADGGIVTASFEASLPLVQEIFRRTIRLVNGEQVVYVDSELESLLGFDRPVNWGEHPTIGGPFLEQGVTVTEMSATRAMTRPHGVDPPDKHDLADSREFTWPMAPTAAGPPIDVRVAPVKTGIVDHTTSLMDPARRLVFVTAFHPGRQALLGYVFRREEYPWTQMWDSYPGGGRSSYRGLEFATQPFDLPRRMVIQSTALFGTPTYRWLPAKSRITSSFVMFYTRTPDGFRKVDDVVLEDGRLTIEDRASGRRIVLNASRGL